MAPLWHWWQCIDDSVLGQSQESRMHDSAPGVNSSQDCGWCTLSGDFCRKHPRNCDNLWYGWHTFNRRLSNFKSVAETFHKKQINCDNIRIPDSALVRVKVMTLGPESTMRVRLWQAIFPFFHFFGGLWPGRTLFLTLTRQESVPESQKNGKMEKWKI